jgi:hypothetical protein
VPPIHERISVDHERRGQWLLPSAARVVQPSDIHFLLPVDPDASWRQGDLLLAQVLAPVGLVDRVQNVNRRDGLNFREAMLHPGTVTVAVLAPRAGTNTCIAEVPAKPVHELHLHGIGGQAGLVVPGSQHTELYRVPPTRVRVLAQLGDKDGNPINTRAFGIDAPREPRARGADDPSLVLVVGADMDNGKTTAARRIIYALRAMGRPVVAGKAVGADSLADIGAMFDAGASEVVDFAMLGEPVTIDLPRKRVVEVFHQVHNVLRAKVGKGGFVVIELADGIWYPETRYVLEDEHVRALVDHVVFACHGVLDAENGLAKLERWGYGSKIRGVSGKLASSGLLRSYLPDILRSRYPVFDALDYESSPEGVARLFTGE